MSDTLKNKISNYEVLPPEDVWKHIVSELSESNPFQPLSGKMYSYEVQPPEDSWRNISLLLKKESITPVRNMRSLFVKLGAAAVVAGLIVVASLFFFQQQSAKHQQITAKQDDKRPMSEKSSTAPDLPLDQPSVAKNSPTVNEKKYTNHTNFSPSRRVTYRQKRRVLTAAAISSAFMNKGREMNDIIVKGRLIRNERGDIIQNPRMITRGDTDEYISVTGPNGQQTRISSKFANMLLYLNGNERMQDEEWQRKFQDWRNKIMQTSFIPSSSNFLDILELKDFILKDKEQ